MFQGSDTGVPRGFFLRQEAHGHRVMSGLGQVVSGLRRPVAQQPVRYLDQTTGTIAHQRVIPHRATVIEISQDLETVPNNVV